MLEKCFLVFFPFEINTTMNVKAERTVEGHQ